VRGRCVLLALAATLAGVAPAVAGGNVGPLSGSTLSLPTALVWGNDVFTSRARLERWLNGRHESFDGWSALHPRATRILIAAEAPPIHFRPSQFAPRKSPRPLLSAGAADRNSSFVPIVPILVGLGLLLVALAALPFPILTPEWAPGAVVYRHRITLLLVGMAVVGALAIARLT
jgi:hypothetical protein